MDFSSSTGSRQVSLFSDLMELRRALHSEYLTALAGLYKLSRC